VHEINKKGTFEVTAYSMGGIKVMKKISFLRVEDIVVRSLSLLFFLTILMAGSLAFAFQTSTSSISDSLDKALSNVLMVKDVNDPNTKAGSEEKAADNKAAPRMEVNLPLLM
jgi:hypothetical protein